MEARDGRRVSDVLLASLARFKGQMVINCGDDIETMAHRAGFSVNIIDPVFNTGNIDTDGKRLNVRTDENSVIKSFSIG